MTPLLWLSSRRSLGRHPWQGLLAVLGVALGVAVVASIGLANAAAERAFDLSTEAALGRATHQVLGAVGGLDESVFLALRALPADLRPIAAPVLEGRFTTPRLPGRALTLLGIDPFFEAPVRPYLGGLGSGRADLAAWLTRPGGLLLARSAAESAGLAVGDSFDIVLDGETRKAVLIGTLEPPRGMAAASTTDLALADLATAQELLGRWGKLSHIDLVVPAGENGAAQLAALRQHLPAGIEIAPASSRGRSFEELTRAFRVNLNALALLAFLCGLFLIFNTMTFSVVSRRSNLGLLRALGTTRREILGLILGEAAVVGATGTVLGLGLGILLSRGLVRLVSRTLNDLYFALEVDRAGLIAGPLLAAAALGLGGTLLAAWLPAREATRAPPRTVQVRSELEDSARRGTRRGAAFGLLIGLLGAGLLALPTRDLVIGFAGLFGVLLGACLSVPAATRVLARWTKRPLATLFGAVGRLAAAGIEASISRTGIAVASLVLAVSVTVGIGVMIRSFRTTLERWLAKTLVADLYVVAPSPSTRGSSLPSSLVDELAALPGVQRINTLLGARLERADGPLSLQVLDLDARGKAAFDFVKPPVAKLWERFDRGEVVLVSEPLAYRRGWTTGARLELALGERPRVFEVGGVYYDYSSERGSVTLSRGAFLESVPAAGVSALAIFLTDNATVEGTAERLRAVAARRNRALEIRPTGRLREASLAIFDRTFRITAVLRLLAGAVAFVGVLSALSALALERARELAILRANGLTPRGVWRLVTTQTALLGAIAGVLSVPVGLLVSWIMITILNRRSFGWLLEMQWSPRILIEAIVLAVTASLLAGVLPARKLARAPLASALKEE